MVYTQTDQLIDHQLCQVQKMHTLDKRHHLHACYSATMDIASLVGTGKMNLMYRDVYEDRMRDLD